MVKIILNFVNTEPNHDTEGNVAINKEYPTVERYYYDTIHHHRKHKMPILSAYTICPVDTWANILWKKLDENSISKDYDGTYVVYLFTRTIKAREVYYDFSAIVSCFKTLAEKIINEFGDDYELVIYADDTFWKVKKFIFGQVNKFFHKRCTVNNIISKPNDEVERENDNVDYSDWEYDDDDEGWL